MTSSVDPERRGSQRAARRAAAAVGVAVLAGVAVTERSVVAASLALLGHLHWLWIPAAVMLESASMAAFAIMLRRLLAAGGARVGAWPMLATAYAANAVSGSVPLAGPALATAFPCRRFTRQGAGRRGNAQPGPGRHRAVRQPCTGRGAALPPGQHRAGCACRVAGPLLAASPPARPAQRPRRG